MTRGASPLKVSWAPQPGAQAVGPAPTAVVPQAPYSLAIDLLSALPRSDPQRLLEPRELQRFSRRCRFVVDTDLMLDALRKRGRQAAKREKMASISLIQQLFAVPEPATLVLLGLGLVGLARLAARERRS